MFLISGQSKVQVAVQAALVAEFTSMSLHTVMCQVPNSNINTQIEVRANLRKQMGKVGNERGLKLISWRHFTGYIPHKLCHSASQATCHSENSFCILPSPLRLMVHFHWGKKGHSTCKRSRICLDSFLSFSQILFFQCPPKLGINMIWALLRAHFNPRLALGLKWLWVGSKTCLCPRT